jgi:hypothetical protein
MSGKLAACGVCGRTDLITVTDNQGSRYLGCPSCTILLEPARYPWVKGIRDRLDAGDEAVKFLAGEVEVLRDAQKARDSTFVCETAMHLLNLHRTYDQAIEDAELLLAKLKSRGHITTR